MHENLTKMYINHWAVAVKLNIMNINKRHSKLKVKCSKNTKHLIYSPLYEIAQLEER